MAVKITNKLPVVISGIIFILLMIFGVTLSAHPSALNEQGCHEGGAEDEYHCHPENEEARLNRRSGAAVESSDDESSMPMEEEIAMRISELEQANEELSMRLERTELILKSPEDLQGFDRDIASRAFGGAFVVYGVSAFIGGIVGTIAVSRDSEEYKAARIGIHWGTMVGYNFGAGLVPAILYSLQQGADAKNSWASSLLVGLVAAAPVIYSINLLRNEL